ncbi:UDP-3-O-(3-hydroxymyristoyl)glucosamine N-acyltransferase [Plastoroseomonas arctica]|uniref:UDP-3-O-acylglucosamine N-acyltransferase n=1 Tax=Plastoroseomonas arctica TaxID=1509237 RepID=A0AAF1K374_9PROT|nr:UDP-3-O-(3-hydroxymyristoyl)glucosamine N-acyltransferase [Plastoroseomonas arctica]MBR0655938.1 UDP-3-O-(3-hydroxymyristoyl)glucosamine N-acyltransferase [Plastoroseomonas arctica]
MAADPRFFATAGPHSLAAIAAAAGAGDVPDGARLFAGVAPLQTAGPDDVSFLDNRRYAAALATSRAGAVVIAAAMAGKVPAGCIPLVTSQPYLGFARVATLFHPQPKARPGVHPGAVIGAGAEIGEGCEIGAYAVVGAGAVLGKGCILEPHAVVGAGVVLGARCRIHSHASICHAIAGDEVVLNAGARIGGEGFGFATDATTGRHVTVPQVGRVILGDGCEIGANSTVDRGSGGDTVLGPGCRLDNLVQIGHNVRLGKGCVIVAMAGIAGSVTLGDYVVVAAQGGIAGHVTVGDRARIGAQAGVMQDVEAGTDVLGSPAQPSREKWRQIAVLRRLATAAIEAERKAAVQKVAGQGRTDSERNDGTREQG